MLRIEAITALPRRTAGAFRIMGARASGPHQLSASRGPQREVGQPWQARDTNGRQRLQTTRAGPRMRGRAISNSRQSSVPEPLLQIRSAQDILNTITSSERAAWKV
jgi:hypothetical protein